MPSLRGLISFDVANKPRSHRDELIAPLSLFRNVINLMRRVRATDYATRGWLGGAGGDERSAAGCSRSLYNSLEFETNARVNPRSLFRFFDLSLSEKLVVRESRVRACDDAPVVQEKKVSVADAVFLPLMRPSLPCLRVSLAAMSVPRMLRGKLMATG